MPIQRDDFKPHFLMIDSLIHWSLRNRALVLVAALILLCVGSYTAMRMPVDVFPDLTAPTVTVITEAHGMAPTEVESQITFPIEAAMNGASGVRRVRSSTAVGISVVWVEFDWGTDIMAARQVVTEKLTLVANELPAEVERPILAPVSSIMGEILFISLTSDRHTGIELRTTADTAIRRRLLAVAGVSQVTPIGGDQKQYQVKASPEKLLAHGVTLDQLTRALSTANENVSAGFIATGGAEYLVTGVGRVRTLEDIENTVIRSTNGTPTKIGDVAEVIIGAAPKRGEGSANTRRAVILGIQKQPGANTLRLTRQLDTVLDEISAKLPQGMTINRRIFRQADFIQCGRQECAHRPDRRRGAGGYHRAGVSGQRTRDVNHDSRHSALPCYHGSVAEGVWRDHQHYDARRHGHCHRRACR